ncbi:MAG: biotin-dependent carboxyltransferase family protein [Pyrinomonadaceae bacterium]
MSILTEKPGILTTIQDLGRHGYRRFGINPSGVMDMTAARLINIVLGNSETEAVLEMHFPAPQIRFEADAIFAIGGAAFGPELNDEAIENWRPYFAGQGSSLKFTNKLAGNRSYLALRGGIEAKEWLGSASTNLVAKMGGVNGRKLESEDRLELKQSFTCLTPISAAGISNSLVPYYSPFPTVRIIRGAEFADLSAMSRDLFLHQDFVVSKNSNRMGFRLIGEPVTLTKQREFISSAVSFGTIQTLPDGQLIVLMADHQTAGGYPRIGHVITRDLPLLAQLGANDKVAFHMIEQVEAEILAMEFERDLSFLRIGCRFQANSW